MSFQLAIKINNVATNDPCAICGDRTDPAIGPDLFLADSWQLVCWKCGKKYAPGLVAMLQTWYSLGAVYDLTESVGIDAHGHLEEWGYPGDR